MKTSRTSTACGRITKVVSILLVSLMMLAVLPLPMSAAEIANVTSQRKSFDIAADDLKERGIFTGYPDGSMGENNRIKRSEMAAICTRLLGLPDGWEDTYTSEKSYPDVPGDHWAIGYILKAYDVKFAQGDPDGKFRPEDNVKMNEAVKMILAAGGHGTDDGGSALAYPRGYMDKAGLMGMLDGVSCEGEVPVSRGAVIMMVYAMLQNEGVVDASPDKGAAGGEFGNLPGNIAAGGRFVQSGNFIYYANLDDNYYLYKAAPDFSSPKKLMSAAVDNINVIGGTIYCVEDGNKIIAVKTDGTDRKVIREGYIVRLYILGGTAYFWESVNDNHYISKMDISGSGYIRLYKLEHGVICQHGCGHEVQMNGARIFFREDDGLKSMNHSGGDIMIMPIKSHPGYLVNETALYVFDYDGGDRGIAKYDFTGKKIETVGGLYADLRNITDEYLYYVEQDFVMRMELLYNSVQIISDPNEAADFLAGVDIVDEYAVITEGKIGISAEYDDECEHFDCECYVYPLSTRIVFIGEYTGEGVGR